MGEMVKFFISMRYSRGLVSLSHLWKRLVWYAFHPSELRLRLLMLFKRSDLSFRLVTFRGARVLVMDNEDVGWRVSVQHEFENAEFDILQSLLRPTDRCLDIGANIGLYSVFFARAAFDGDVISVEPVPLNAALLQVNIALNQLTNVRVQQVVVSDQCRLSNFSISVDGAYSSICGTGRRPELRHVKLPATTVDNLLGSARVDIMKVDVEGAELLVLRGATGLLMDSARRPRAVLIELCRANQAVYRYEPEEVIRLMDSFGYKAFSITPGGVVDGWPSRGAAEDVLFRVSAI